MTGCYLGSALPNYVNGRRSLARRRGKPRFREEDVYAALDLGTNNCRLLIARPAAEGFRVIDVFSRIVRLGEGLSQNGRLSEAAMMRTIDALRVCARKIRRRRVTTGRAVATEACRRAGNCDIFVERVKRETGLDLEIISNSEEATLGLYGCTPLLDPVVPGAIIFDIGGGSTEVSWLRVNAEPDCRRDPLDSRRQGSRSAPRPSLEGWYSVPTGVVTLAERYGGIDIAEAAYEAMIEEMLQALRPFDDRHGLSAMVARGDVQMLGTSGTVTTLSGIDKQLPRYDRARVDGSYLDFDTVARLSRRIAGMSYQDRVAHPCIGTERADLVVAGCAILEAICRTWPVGRLRVADRGLREGILFTLMSQPSDEARSNGVGAAGRETGG